MRKISVTQHPYDLAVTVLPTQPLKGIEAGRGTRTELNYDLISHYHTNYWLTFTVTATVSIAPASLNATWIGGDWRAARADAD